MTNTKVQTTVQVSHNEEKRQRWRQARRRYVETHLDEVRAKAREYMRRVRAENPEHSREINRRYYEAHLEERRAACRSYYHKNRARELERMRKYHRENAQFLRDQSSAYRKEHIEERRAADRMHYEKNREAILLYQKEYYGEHEKEIRARTKAKWHIPPKSNCEKCASPENLARHHPDYDKPLEIVTLCRSCHGKLHGEANRRYPQRQIQE